MIGSKESFDLMAKTAREIREHGTCAGDDQKNLTIIATHCEKAAKMCVEAAIAIDPLKKKIEKCFKLLNRQAVIEVTQDFAARKSKATAHGDKTERR